MRTRISFGLSLARILPQCPQEISSCIVSGLVVLTKLRVSTLSVVFIFKFVFELPDPTLQLLNTSEGEIHHGLSSTGRD